MKNVSGAISSPNRYSRGIITKTAPHTRLTAPSHHSSPPITSWNTPNENDTAAAIQLAIIRTRSRRPARSLRCRVGDHRRLPRVTSGMQTGLTFSTG